MGGLLSSLADCTNAISGELGQAVSLSSEKTGGRRKGDDEKKRDMHRKLGEHLTEQECLLQNLKSDLARICPDEEAFKRIKKGPNNHEKMRMYRILHRMKEVADLMKVTNRLFDAAERELGPRNEIYGTFRDAIKMFDIKDTAAPEDELQRFMLEAATKEEIQSDGLARAAHATEVVWEPTLTDFNDLVGSCASAPERPRVKFDSMDQRYDIPDREDSETFMYDTRGVYVPSKREMASY